MRTFFTNNFLTSIIIRNKLGWLRQLLSLIYQRTILTSSICRCNTLRVEKVWRSWKLGKCYILTLANSDDLKTPPAYRNFPVRVFYSNAPQIMHKSETFKMYLCCVFNRCLFFRIQGFSYHGHTNYFCLFIKINFNLHKFTGFTL